MSRTYQLDSTPNETNKFDKNNFAARLRPAADGRGGRGRAERGAGRRARSSGPATRPGRARRWSRSASSRLQNPNLAYAFRIFGRPPRTTACDCERAMEPALPQTLFRMTDPTLLGEAQRPQTAASRSSRKAKLTDDELVEELFLATLSPLADGEREGRRASSTCKDAKTAPRRITDVALGADQHARVHPEPLTVRSRLPAVRRESTGHDSADPNPHGRRAMATLRRTDCEGFHRRDFLKIGVGRAARPDPAAAPRGSRRRPPSKATAGKAKAKTRHPGLARRRPGHHRHVGPQARRPRGHPRRVQVDRHQRRRRPDRRAPAEDGRRSSTRSPSSARWTTRSRRTARPRSS